MANISNNLDSTKNVDRADAWAGWLQDQSWERFCTFTTGYELTLPGARRLMERFHDRISHKVFNDPVRLFWVAERFETKDGYHTHGLLDYNVAEAEQGGWDAMEVMTESYQIVSAARKHDKRYRVSLSRYNASRSAGRYCSKYLLKRYADFDMLING